MRLWPPTTSPRHFATLLASCLLALNVATRAQAQSPPITLECDNTSLTTYLLSLLDLLYANGLTIYEDLIVTLAQTDEGYEMLLDLFAAPSVTLLVPTDAAFREANIQGFTQKGGAAGTDEQAQAQAVRMFVYHALQGGWDKMANGVRGVASTMMTMEEGMAVATETSRGIEGGGGSAHTAYQAMVLQKAEEKITVRMAVGNGTTWAGPVDMRGHEVLSNLVVLPIDKLPPPLSEALTLPTSTRSAKGFPKFAKAFSSDQIEQLGKLNPGGFTVFAVVDDGIDDDWSGDLKAHYTTNYTLFSPTWRDAAFSGLPLESGDIASFSQDEGGTFVSLDQAKHIVNVSNSSSSPHSDGARRILRADIVLQNGVLHIIDGPLHSSNSSSTSSNTTKSISGIDPTGGLSAESSLNASKPSSGAGANPTAPMVTEVVMTSMARPRLRMFGRSSVKVRGLMWWAVPGLFLVFVGIV